jgi:molybdenum cofactor synthesis domain-containing protein
MALTTTEALEAYAFRALCAHLQARPQVQNIDVMTLTGFCRNCLAKWYLRAAETLGRPLAGGYDEACERVYGMPLDEWKRAHQLKASAEQTAAYEQSKPLHATHGPAASPVPPPLSDVCCTDPADAAACARPALDAASPPPPPSDFVVRLGVLTASDRAAAGTYADESGPAIIAALRAHGERTGAWRVETARTAVVPDERDAIRALLDEWSAPGAEGGGAACALILTTGGTGCAPRDVTPEATLDVLDRQIPGITEAFLWRALPREPHAMLSRAVAGVRARTLIVNLPGRPSAVRENLAVLMPVLRHALAQIGGEPGEARAEPAAS